VSRIIIGELAGIRNGNDHHGRQVNTMIHNYWSQKHVADRLTWAAEELQPSRGSRQQESVCIVFEQIWFLGQPLF